ncbi:MAG: GNAT family N-acetyltransferase [Candidatus Thiodiazotropha sp. (ex. Lucinisca nassula)]|nr:GNAT family N-acetyltransferase [Candidatus Thiodiazotropha sp. (ex. Lucinisca nassula)]MBW9269594.1 GNAT family N-acetyltransferase [Candidatus Thiodiazotropha sp. (ex. Lucinisca nassula)]
MQSNHQYATAKPTHYQAIISLIKSPQELFLIYPAADWPFDIKQLEKLATERSDLTVVLDGDLVIGFANLYSNLSGSKRFVGNVVVSQDYRGKGIGRALVRYMCDRVFERYANEVHITVFNHNLPALTLYASMGFKPYDMELRKMPSGGQAMAIHMQLNRRGWQS